MFRSDAHKILGTTDKSTPDEIKKRYRSLASKWHPDKNPGKEEEAKKKFQELQEALDVLENPKRSAPNGPRSNANNGFSTHYVNPEDMAEFIRNFQNGFRTGTQQDQRPRPDKIDDYQDNWSSSGPGARSRGPQVMNAVISISLEEAFNGCTKTISVPNPQMISGAPIQVSIPRGVSESDCVRQIETADTLVRCFVKINCGEYRVQFAGPFNINGAGNILREQKLSPFIMMLGGFIEVKTIDGATQSVRVPAGLQANMMLKLQGKGYWTGLACTERGDMLIRMVPDIQKLDEIDPARLTEFRDAINAHLEKKK